MKKVITQSGESIRKFENVHNFCQGHWLMGLYSSASVSFCDSCEIVPRSCESGTESFDPVAQLLGQRSSSATSMSTKSALCGAYHTPCVKLTQPRKPPQIFSATGCRQCTVSMCLRIVLCLSLRFSTRSSQKKKEETRDKLHLK